MRSVFADTFFFIALLDKTDRHHDDVREHVARNDDFLITTRWVLVETANYFCGSAVRERAAIFLRDLEGDPSVQIVGPSDVLYEPGLELYSERPDKEWSLTDCISFIVMRERDLREALTSDRHFAQAGFVPLFAL